MSTSQSRCGPCADRADAGGVRSGVDCSSDAAQSLGGHHRLWVSEFTPLFTEFEALYVTPQQEELERCVATPSRAASPIVLTFVLGTRATNRAVQQYPEWL
jgi:hypothetical protein